MITRRRLIGVAAAAAVSAPPRVVVIGGGFAGGSCARWLKRLEPGIRVTLVEAERRFTACPFSNGVIAGERSLEQQRFGYGAFNAAGIALRFSRAVGIDPVARRVTLADGGRLDYDRLVLAPGIDFRWDALPGYGQSAAARMPHAWKAGEQTELLRRQLTAMEDGGLVVIAAPANPFRCPPGPYERASLIAHYLKRAKPRSKLMILDAKDAFSKQKLFEAAWAKLYPGLIEWVSLSKGGKVIGVDPAAMTLATDFTSVKAAVANVIPPQKAGEIAQLAGVADRSGWCPIDPVTCESTQVARIHVIGDAAIAGAMPKSAFAANAQAKACAVALVSLFRGDAPASPLLVNTCYSLVAPDYGISVAGVYHAEGGVWGEIKGAGGVSPLSAPSAQRAEEARLANGWFNTITADVFG
jgi:sulfide dehydrogenase [flavocytochrome c] flavoprotein subunit